MTITSPSLPSGFRVGHWTDTTAATGCTVVLCPPGTVGACEVRGSSPGSRELELLSPLRSMQEVHAVLLTGGSAFGLAAADGVMRFLEAGGVGYPTPWGRVPIVPAAVVFDLNIGDGRVRPDAVAGEAACRAATASGIGEGSVGAGTGATVGKWGGMEGRMKGGVGLATEEQSGVRVSALAVVNAVGDVLDEGGEVLAGARDDGGTWRAGRDPLRTFAQGKPLLGTNTTLAVIMTNARLAKVEAAVAAGRAHNGMARAIRPVHTSYDGDLVIDLCAGEVVPPHLDLVAEMGAGALATAVRRAVRAARTLHGVPGLRE